METITFWYNPSLNLTLKDAVEIMGLLPDCKVLKPVARSVTIRGQTKIAFDDLDKHMASDLLKDKESFVVNAVVISPCTIL